MRTDVTVCLGRTRTQTHTGSAMLCHTVLRDLCKALPGLVGCLCLVIFWGGVAMDNMASPVEEQLL